MPKSDPGEIRTKIFRHTYCAARLQTLDRGFPISTYTVARKLGHGGDSLIKRVYGSTTGQPRVNRESRRALRPICRARWPRRST